MSSYWPFPASPPGTSGLPPSPYHQYGQPFQGQPNWQGGQPPWLAALLAAHQNANPHYGGFGHPMPPTGIPPTGIFPPQPGPVPTGIFPPQSGPPPTGIFPTQQPPAAGFPPQGFGHPMPPTVGRVGV